ncbi:nitroreductase family protein [Psychrobacillus vulpis]|uniref:Nitroreductase family protein n=1 Tax=Psychrobacillus vulpis TaxID=2325572 RepID=A0A544TSH9_9BACI|nr:nitroreductase family protein [Psychrobacillus vulpis]TQR20397.1 nitroreductase family protein [Psychrobacillus vulpis]
MTEFIELVKSRRSASNFLKENSMTQKDFKEIFELVKLAPSAFNLQHTKYLVVTDPEVKEQLKTAANGQYKVQAASAVILVLGNKLAYKNTAAINEGLLMLGIVNKQEYDFMVEDTVSLYETRGEAFQRDEAIRNASLSAMMFMLVAKDKGWDTCPMIGFDPEETKKILGISNQYEPVLMITIGKEKLESRKPRGYRKPVGEFVSYV